MNVANVVVGHAAKSSGGASVKLAALRALRTFLQGVAASFGTGAAGDAILDATYWEAVGVAIIGAAITAFASFIHNISTFLPVDPSQVDET